MANILLLFVVSAALGFVSCIPADQEKLTPETSNGCNTSEGPCWRRTIIVIYKETTTNQYLYVRGGSFNTHEGIPIRHRVKPTNTSTFYGETSINDKTLDWFGGESGQGWFENHAPQGTPMMWTTNRTDYHLQVSTHGAGYHPLNKLGDHYWLVDLDMDCSKLGSRGLFEFKGYLVYLNDGRYQWEQSYRERAKCGLDRTQSTAGNHVGRCGMLNAVQFDGTNCDIVTPIGE